MLQSAARPGAFVPGPVYRGGARPVALGVGDIDGDGETDVASSDLAGSVSLLLATPAAPDPLPPSAGSLNAGRSCFPTMRRP